MPHAAKTSPQSGHITLSPRVLVTRMNVNQLIQFVALYFFKVLFEIVSVSYVVFTSPTYKNLLDQLTF